MIQRGKGLRFTLKPGYALGVRDKGFRQNLDRDVAIQLRVTGSVDLAHAADPKQGADLVRAEAGADNQCQVRLRWIIRPHVASQRRGGYRRDDRLIVPRPTMFS